MTTVSFRTNKDGHVEFGVQDQGVETWWKPTQEDINCLDEKQRAEYGRAVMGTIQHFDAHNLY